MRVWFYCIHRCGESRSCGQVVVIGFDVLSECFSFLFRPCEAFGSFFFFLSSIPPNSGHSELFSCQYSSSFFFFQVILLCISNNQVTKRKDKNAPFSLLLLRV